MASGVDTRFRPLRRALQRDRSYTNAASASVRENVHWPRSWSESTKAARFGGCYPTCMQYHLEVRCAFTRHDDNLVPVKDWGGKTGRGLRGVWRSSTGLRFLVMSCGGLPRIGCSTSFMEGMWPCWPTL